MSTDYFDDDDLINDYMEEDFEPPPEAYDEEAFTFEESNERQESHDNHETDEPPVSVEEIAAPTAATNDVTMEDNNDGASHDAEINALPYLRPEDDLYSFER
jgi:hypothetical protein